MQQEDGMMGRKRRDEPMNLRRELNRHSLNTFSEESQPLSRSLQPQVHMLIPVSDHILYASIFSIGARGQQARDEEHRINIKSCLRIAFTFRVGGGLKGQMLEGFLLVPR